MPAQEEKLTIGDRLVTGLLAGILGFGTMAVIWFLVLNLGAHTGENLWFPFSWAWIVGGAAAATGFIVGPERMVDGFQGFWRALGAIMFWRIRDRDVPTPRRRKPR